MNNFFLTLIFLHGSIHLIGFSTAIGLLKMDNLKLDISMLSGILWLLTALLFFVAGINYFFKISFWQYLLVLAILFSMVLISMVWNEAQFGTIPNIILALTLIITSGSSFDKKIAKEKSKILMNKGNAKIEIVFEDQISNLPAPVKRWLKSSGIIGKENIQTVWLKQKAFMRLKPNQKNWYESNAEQIFTTENPAFLWTVNLKMAPFIKIKGRDKFEDGKGEMLIKINSLINVVNEKGRKIDEGTMQRYLGEIIWFPSAALSEYIKWEHIDSHSAKATMNYKGTSGSGTFHFNEYGDLIRFIAMRYKENKPNAPKYEWIVDVKESRILNNIKIPTKMTTTWKLPEGDWTWMKLELEEIKYNFV